MVAWLCLNAAFGLAVWYDVLATRGGTLRERLERVAKPAPPVEASPPTPKHRTRGSGMFGARGTYAETDPLYRAIRSGMPIDAIDDEHAVTVSIRQRVNVMVMEPMDKKIADLEQQLRSVRLANSMLKEVSNAETQEATGLGWFEAGAGSGRKKATDRPSPRPR